MVKWAFGLGVAYTVAAAFYSWTLIQTEHVGVGLTPEQRLERGRRAVAGPRRA